MKKVLIYLGTTIVLLTGFSIWLLLKVGNLERSQYTYKDSIQNQYKDSLMYLNNALEETRSNQYAVDCNAERGWKAYDNMVRIADSLEKTKTKYINVYSTIKNEVPKDADMVTIPVLITKKEYDYLNRFEN